MSQRERVLKIEDRGTRIENGREVKSVIVIRLYYAMGGMNYWNYKVEPRGYFLSVTPEEREDTGTFTVRRTTLGSGYKSLVKEAARFSQKTLDSIDETTLQAKIAEMTAAVLVKAS